MQQFSAIKRSQLLMQAMDSYISLKVSMLSDKSQIKKECIFYDSIDMKLEKMHLNLGGENRSVVVWMGVGAGRRQVDDRRAGGDRADGSPHYPDYSDGIRGHTCA